MRKQTWSYIAAALVGMVVLAGLIYRIPSVNRRLSWRVDFALTYLRTQIDPIKPLPTALPEPETYVARITADGPSSTLAASPTPTEPIQTPTPEASPTPTPSPTPLPERVILPPPKWEKQDINNCGPAALAMYLRFYGWEGDQETISRVIKPFREDRNVNVEELAFYARNHAGWLNIQYRVGGDLVLLKRLLAAGIPVLIEETFYFDEPFWTNDDLWAAHYQLVTGYDDAARVFIGQDSYHGADQKVPYETLDEYWQAFNRVYFLVYPPQQEPVIQQILGESWDPDANRRFALEIARVETEADPTNAFAWFNLGNNLTYFEEYIPAAEAFDKARELGLPQRMLRYQFTPFMAYFHTGRLNDLLALTAHALEVTPNAEEALLWNGWGLYREGDTAGAEANFQQALVENPNYQDAHYALDFIRNNR